MEFYNNLNLKDSKNKNLKLSDESKLADFFIDDQNEFGKSYKKIYVEFIKEQNGEISDLLENKIEKEVFERNCKDKIGIQSASENEIFITNLSDKFSFVEVVFNCSYRKIALDKNVNSYNQFEVDLSMIEDEMTEILLRNKKLFKDDIINFVYSNEKLEFENTNIITQFNGLYELEKINLRDKIILYQFYQDNKEKNLDFFLSILNDFKQLIIFLNNNKRLLNEEKKALFLKDDYRIIQALEKLTKVSDDFKNLFKDNDSLTIKKTTYLFEYYRDLIFGKIKNSIKAYQNDLESEQKDNIKSCLENLTIIKENEKQFKATIRAFITLFLIFEKDKENNIRQNENNVINYFDIPDIWDSTISSMSNFKEELNNLKQLNIKINQIVSFYDLLGEDITPKYFEDVKKEVEREKEIQKIIEKEPEPVNEEEEEKPDNPSEENFSDYDDDNKSGEESDDGESKYV